MSDILSISQCNLAQTIGETNRFLFHVILVHFATCIIEGKKAFFGEELFRTLLITAMAITMYHVFFRKIIEPKIEKMKLICYNGKDRVSKQREISKQYHSESKQTYINSDESRKTAFSESEDFITQIESKKSRSTTKEYKQKSKGQTKSTGRGNTPRDYSKRQQVLRD